jgi:anti-anti-sigma factor
MALSDSSLHLTGSENGSGPGSPHQAPFNIELKPDRERVIVCVSGEVDLSTADQLEGSVSGLLERGFPQVIVHLRGVTFLDSSGIHALLACHRLASDLKALMQVILGDQSSRRALEMTGVIDHLNVASTDGGTKAASWSPD